MTVRVPRASLAPHIAQRSAAALVGWRLTRLRTALDAPLAVVATGTTRAVAVLWARLHEARHPAWAVTPADFVSRPLPAGARVLLLSATGRHHDMLAAAREATRRGAPVHAVTHDRSSPLCGVVRSGGGDVTVLPAPPRPKHLAEPDVAVPMLVLAGTLYGGPGPWLQVFNAPAPPLPVQRPRQVLALATGLASAAAVDFASRCRESGLAPARAADPRDVAHGDLLTLAPTEDWLLHFALPEQAAYLTRYDALLPPDLTVIRLQAERSGAAGALELFARGASLFRTAARRFDARPRVETLPDWLKSLYRLAVP